MPQPLSSFKTKHCTFYPNSAEQYPALAAKIIVVLAAWAHLETKTGWVFSRLLGAEEEKGIAIYNALSNLGAHTVEQVFEAVAAIALTQEQRDFAQAIRIMTKSVRDQRNPIAHGFWGLSPDIPNALLLRSPRESLKAVGHLTRRFEAIREEARKSGELDDEDFKLTEADIGDVYVYREKDFLTLHERIITVHQHWSDFDACFLLPKPHDAIYESSRRRLLGSGEVLDRVNRIRAGRQEPPLPPF